MTTRLRPVPTPDRRPPQRAPQQPDAKRERSRPAAAAPSIDRPSGAGFVLYVGVDDSFGHGPQALRELIEAAETLQELARDLLPTAGTHTTLSLTPPAA